MFAVSHDQDFVNDEILLWLLFEVHLLDGHAFVCADFKCCVYTTGSTLTNLDEVTEFLGRIGRIANVLQLANDLGICD